MWRGMRPWPAAVDSPIATGEMLCSADHLKQYISRSAVDVLQPDAARIGGITPYLKVADLADAAGMRVAPPFYYGNPYTPFRLLSPGVLGRAL